MEAAAIVTLVDIFKLQLVFLQELFVANICRILKAVSFEETLLFTFRNFIFFTFLNLVWPLLQMFLHCVILSTLLKFTLREEVYIHWGRLTEES
jgi:hypothetical protein